MTATTELLPSYIDVKRLAVASFLARYREPTLTAYTQDLRAFFGWCQQTDLDIEAALVGHQRICRAGHLLWVRDDRGSMLVRPLERRAGRR